MKDERGQATAVVLSVATLVVLTIVGLGIYAYKNPTIGLYGKDDENKPTAPSGDYGNTTQSTIAIATSTSSSKPSTTSSSGSVTKPKTSASSATAYRAVTGPAYHNSTFGLTVPGSYTVTQTQNVYGGVPTTLSINFYTSGVYAFTINIFSKEQWNNIRIQETINNKEGTGPNYLGEGHYLGENFVWIYSIIYGAYQPSGVRFY